MSRLGQPELAGSRERPGSRDRCHGNDLRRTRLPVRAFYSVAELARAGNVPTYRLLRLLRRNGVTFLRSGRAFYVSLDEIRRRIPPLWTSLQLAEDLRIARRTADEEPKDRSPRAPRSPRTDHP